MSRLNLDTDYRQIKKPERPGGVSLPGRHAALCTNLASSLELDDREDDAESFNCRVDGRQLAKPWSNFAVFDAELVSRTGCGNKERKKSGYRGLDSLLLQGRRLSVDSLRFGNTLEAIQCLVDSVT